MGILKKFSDYWSSRLTEDAIKKISAALGSFLILALTSLSLPLNSIITDMFGSIWALYFIVIWGGFVGYIGTFIVTVFGTTSTLLPETDEEVLEAIEDAEEQAEEILEETPISE